MHFNIMKIELRNNQDFFAGLLFTVIGLLAVVLSQNYPFGSVLRMGLGYFPTVLGGIMTGAVDASVVRSSLTLPGTRQIGIHVHH